MVGLDLATLAAFVPAALALILAPGPDTAFVLSQSVGGGRRSGLTAAAGVATGILVHTTAVVVGVAALVRLSPVAFTLLKTVGAAYLGYLGVRAFQGAGGFSVAHDARPSGSSYRRGLLVNVSNPKVAVFFLAFLPQFVGDVALSGSGGDVALFVLGGVYSLLTVGYLGGVALVSSRVRTTLEETRLGRWLELVTGVVLVGFALQLLVLG